jgi:PAS domain S-box-containing protein
MALVSAAPSAPSETPDETIRRLTGELREARDQQAAATEILEIINHSPGNLAPVFDAILEKAHSLCGAEYSVLLTHDGELFWPAAIHGTPPTFPERREGIRPGFGFTGLVRGERLLHIQDMVEVVAQRPDDPVPRALVENGIRTQLAVPLRKDGRLLGIITANRQEVLPFSDNEIALLENFAAQAVIAMENARLLTETREALEQQTATAEILQVINSSPGDLAPVFDAILQKAQTLCDAAYGSLMLYDGESFRAVAVYSVSEAFAERLREGFPVSNNPFAQRLLDGAGFVHVSDLAEIDHPIAQAAVELTGVRTRLMVPLRKDDVLLGVISIVRQEVRPFTDKQIALLQNFAAQAVIAMENARLLGELHQRTQELTRREAALRDSEERYVLAMRAINEGVYEWDVATSEMYYSPRVCELVGLGASELRTMTDWTDRIHADDRDAFRKAILAHFKGETDRLEAEYRYRHADGSWHWARQHGIALKNEVGRVYRVVGSTGDITDRKAAEQALREALEQQTATAEVLQVINSSPGDLAPVFDAMLEKALALCGASFGMMNTYDGQQFHATATRGVPEALAEFRKRNALVFVPGTPPALILEGEREHRPLPRHNGL